MYTYRLGAAVMGGLFLFQNIGQAQVVTDGTTGVGKAITGPDYDIVADLGTQAGSNLFHSFDQFSIGNGESATFSGPGSIDNIISRVTGGDVSSIDGLLASTIPGASLWLFNPAGVVFGPNASLDVTGSFHVSSADELRTADGGRFSAVDPESSGFSVAEPKAFGFLGADPAGITVARSQLSVNDGETLSIVGGDVDIARANLAVGNGKLNIVAADGPAAVDVATGNVTGASDGNITVRDTASLNAIGDGGGSIRIEGGAFVVDEDSTILSTNTGATDGDVGIDIDVKTADLKGDSLITTDAQADGKGGDINLRADDVQVTDNTIIASSSGGAGDGGDIDITAGDGIAFRDNGLAISATVGGGDGGNIGVTAEDLTLSNGDIVTSAGETSSGDGGDIVIAAGSLEVGATGPGDISLISTISQGSGDTGNIDVRGNRVVLDGGTQLNGAAISTLLEGGATGGGQIRLKAGSLDLLRGGAVSAESTGRPDGAANIDVTADRILIDGGIAPGLRLTGINLASDIRGDTPGAIVIRSGKLDIRNGGVISTITGNDKDGGDIILTVDNLSVSGGTRTRRSQISSSSFTGATGDAGRIVIVADSIELDGNGTIRGAALGEGDAGVIDITARSSLQLRGTSAINTSTGVGTSGDAGSISIATGDLTISGASEIISATFGSGAAGSIDLVANSALLDAQNSGIFGGISTQGGPGSSGDAGNITLSIDDLTLLNTAQISSGAFGSGNAGAVSLTSNTITIDAQEEESRFLTGITTAATSDAGDSGAIAIDADLLILRGLTANISSSNDSAGSAGTIDIQLTDGLINDSGLISTLSASGGGGGITIDAGKFITATGVNSQITTNVADDTGNAGDIVLSAPTLALGDAQILAQADAGRGGDIQVSADDLILSSDAVINAQAGATGVDGTIVVSAPEVDLGSGLATFDGQFLDISSLLRERCAVRRAGESSSFTLGTGGTLPIDLDAPRLSLLGSATDDRGQRTILVLPCPKSAS